MECEILRSPMISYRSLLYSTTVLYDIYIYVSYIAVAMYSRDRYEIIGLREISHFIKQPCKNVCLEKVL